MSIDQLFPDDDLLGPYKEHKTEEPTPKPEALDPRQMLLPMDPALIYGQDKDLEDDVTPGHYSATRIGPLYTGMR